MTPTRYLLPRMTNPLGRSWGQPGNLRDRVGLYFNHATILESDWLELSDYRTTTPSGVYPGKVWRCGDRLRWYGPEQFDAQGGFCKVGSLRALIQGPGTNITYRGPVKGARLYVLPDGRQLDFYAMSHFLHVNAEQITRWVASLQPDGTMLLNIEWRRKLSDLPSLTLES